MGVKRAIARGFLNFADRRVHFERAYAHCDIPCGIYDPHLAQVAAHTVIRMDMLIAETAQVPPTDASTRNKMIRYVTTKEQHAELVKHEIRVIWGDYVKPEMATPEVHKLVWEIMRTASKAKQDADIKTAKELLAKVQEFAEWFWKTKEVKTVRVKSPYPSGEEMVYPQM
jgi:nickel superoxide dismutase